MKLTLTKNDISLAIEKHLSTMPGIGQVYTIDIEGEKDLVGENSFQAVCNVEFLVVKKQQVFKKQNLTLFFIAIFLIMMFVIFFYLC